MPNLLVEDRIIECRPGPVIRLADGQTAWHLLDPWGNQVMTRVGVEVDLLSCANRAIPGLMLEFGVAGGNSILELSRSGRQIYGFDWWRGLPHAWTDGDPRGSCFALKPEVPPNVELVEGLFSDTLEDFLVAHPGSVAFVHIDCDLYAPTVFILHCLRDRFVAGSVIAFDEIEQGNFGEFQAWDRYLRETGQSWEFIGKQHQWGCVYRFAG